MPKIVAVTSSEMSILLYQIIKRRVQKNVIFIVNIVKMGGFEC